MATIDGGPMVRQWGSSQLLQHSRGLQTFAVASANQGDADVLHKLRCIKAKLPIDVQATWFKSHQEACLTR